MGIQGLSNWPTSDLRFPLRDSNSDCIGYFVIVRTIFCNLQRLHAEGPDKTSYCHELFLLGRPDLAKTTIILKKNREEITKVSIIYHLEHTVHYLFIGSVVCVSVQLVYVHSKSIEPNFYAISEKYPLAESTSKTNCQRASARIFTSTRGPTNYFTMSTSTGNNLLHDRHPSHGCSQGQNTPSHPSVYLHLPRYLHPTTVIAPSSSHTPSTLFVTSSYAGVSAVWKLLFNLWPL